MIFWKRPFKMDINEITDIAFAILSTLKEYGDNLEPNYLSIKKNNEATKFELNIENVRTQLENNINEEDSICYPELGRSLGFFSSLEDNVSSGIKMTIGASAKHVTNSVIIKLPIGYFDKPKYNMAAFDNLFRNIVTIFSPFWGCVNNNLSNKQFGFKLWKNDKPTSVHWMNYFDNSIVQNLDKDNLLSIFNLERLNDGYYFKLQRNPFNVENPDHIAQQMTLNKVLGLV